jgi:hypothetical protein
MLSYANPIASRVARSPSQVDRRVMCACYENCLDLAIKRKWVGFSCRKCRAFEPINLNLSEWLADSLACVALMYVSEFQPNFKQKPRGGIVLRLKRIKSSGDILGST